MHKEGEPYFETKVTFFETRGMWMPEEEEEMGEGSCFAECFFMKCDPKA